MKNSYTDEATVFKAFSDENRLVILELLRDGEKCANDLLDTVKVSQSTLSHHMKVMCASGIIKSRKDGTSTYYSINPNGVENAIKLVGELTAYEVTHTRDTDKPTQKSAGKTTSPNSSNHSSRPKGWLL